MNGAGQKWDVDLHLAEMKAADSDLSPVRRPSGAAHAIQPTGMSLSRHAPFQGDPQGPFGKTT